MMAFGELVTSAFRHSGPGGAADGPQGSSDGPLPGLGMGSMDGLGPWSG